MGVYIKGMTLDQFEMNNCDDCFMEYYCECGQHIDGYSMNGGRPTFCPLVEVKEPHGRLIDAEIVSSAIADVYDIFIKNNGKVTQKSMDCLIASTVDSKTIIEAEK